MCLFSTEINYQHGTGGHVIPVGEARIPKQLLYGELSEGHRRQGSPRKRLKDCIKPTSSTAAPVQTTSTAQQGTGTNSEPSPGLLARPWWKAVANACKTGADDTEQQHCQCQSQRTSSARHAVDCVHPELACTAT